MTKSKLTIDDFGNKYWHNEKREYHREDGPAVESFDGIKHWMINNNHHRVDGPAFECPNGDKSWFINGERHREDGPAIEWSNRDKEWYYHGKQIYCNSQEEFERIIELLIFE